MLLRCGMGDGFDLIGEIVSHVLIVLSAEQKHIMQSIEVYKNTIKSAPTVEQRWTGRRPPMTKPCYGLCSRCVWRYNGGCSMWNGWCDDD